MHGKPNSRVPEGSHGIDQQHKAVTGKCNGMQGNARDIGKAEAQYKVAKAQAKRESLTQASGAHIVLPIVIQ